MIFLVIFLMVFVFWYYAEKRSLSLSVRLASGLASMAFIGFAIAAVSNVGPSYERNYHKADMRQMEQIFTNGDTQVVLRALHTYNGITATGSTYSAASEMYHVLNEAEKH